MDVPPEISFNNMEREASLEALVRRRIDKLERYCDHITSCHVAIERRQTSVSTGSEFRVRIDVRMPPRHELVAKRRQGKENRFIGADEAIHRAFDAAERRVKAVVERQQDRSGYR